MIDQHIAEYRPEWRLVVDELPPIGKKILMRGLHSGIFVGDYHREYGAVAWAGLPTFSPEQRRRLNAMEAAGVDPTLHPGVRFLTQDLNLPSCVGVRRDDLPHES